MKKIIAALLLVMAGIQFTHAYQETFFVESSSLTEVSSDYNLKTITDRIHHRNGTVEYRTGKTKAFAKGEFQVEILKSDVKAIGNMNISEKTGHIVQVIRIADQLAE